MLEDDINMVSIKRCSKRTLYKLVLSSESYVETDVSAADSTHTYILAAVPQIGTTPMSLHDTHHHPTTFRANIPEPA